MRKYSVLLITRQVHTAERRDELPQIVLEQNHDIIMLQEVWVDEDVARFKDKAKEAGYYVHTGPRDEYNDGCVILIRKSIMKDENVLTEGGVDYAQRDGLEYFPGPGIKRGFIFLSFEHTSLGTIHVYNTHMMPWWYNWGVRMAEARQVSLHVLEHAQDEEIVFLGGDMNAGSYYKNDVWVTGDKEDNDGWWANTISYTFFTHYGDFLDLLLMGRDANEVELDISEGTLWSTMLKPVLRFPALRTIGVILTAVSNFTASDCNDPISCNMQVRNFRQEWTIFSFVTYKNGSSLLKVKSYLTNELRSETLNQCNPAITSAWQQVTVSP